jgi:hypothetical protein
MPKARKRGFCQTVRAKSASQFSLPARSLRISHDAQVRLVGVGAHQAAVAAAEEVKLHPVIQPLRRAEM